MNILDGLIYVTIVLFILSVIVEKITQLIRQYPWQVKWIALAVSLGLEVLLIRTCNEVVGDNLLLTGLISLIGIVSVFLLATFSSKFRSEHTWVKKSIIPLIGVLLFLLVVIGLSKPGHKLETWQWGLLLLVNTAGMFLTVANLPDVRKKFIWAATDMAVLKNISKDAAEPDLKEKEVTFLSFVIGFFIAFSFNANLIEMFLHPNKDALGWGEIELISSSWILNPKAFLSVYLYFGFGLTGFFLAFGSKFFHDLLDTLLQVKELKRKLNDKKTYQNDSSKKFDEFIALSENDIVTLAISQNESVLKNKFKNILIIKDSVAVVGGQKKNVACIYLLDSLTAGLPKEIPARLPSGRVIMVGTEVVLNGGMGTASGGGYNGSIANENSPNYAGSVCCVVRDSEQEFLLTNCHVMTEEELADADYDVSDDQALYNDTKVGTWHFGSMDSRGDFALISLEDPDLFFGQEGRNAFGALRELSKADLHLRVFAKGNKCQQASGYVCDIVEKEIGIAYKYGRPLIFDRVILVGSSVDKNESRPITSKGDSGGSVFDESNNLIGIITGKNDHFTFVIPLSSFFKDLKLKLA